MRTKVPTPESNFPFLSCFLFRSIWWLLCASVKLFSLIIFHSFWHRYKTYIHTHTSKMPNQWCVRLGLQLIRSFSQAKTVKETTSRIVEYSKNRLIFHSNSADFKSPFKLVGLLIYMESLITTIRKKNVWVIFGFFSRTQFVNE